ncbi:MAG: c-type cytochrome [Pseudoxanthomonas sp.]
MGHARLAGLAIAVAGACAAVAWAQTTVTPLPETPPAQAVPLEIDLTKTHWGDAKAGQSKATACAACHGVDGNPTVSSPVYPRLAGQSERYIAQQLAQLATGQRTDAQAAIMAPYAQALSAQDMRDVGAYFAAQKPAAGIADDAVVADGPYKGLKFYQIGEQLYRGGDAGRGIPACMGCHGPTGAGNPGPAYPHVGGQPQDYVVQRLQYYQAGSTAAKDPTLFQIMAQVAKPLTDQEVHALASYLQGLHDAGDDVAGKDAAPAPSGS